MLTLALDGAVSLMLTLALNGAVSLMVTWALDSTVGLVLTATLDRVVSLTLPAALGLAHNPASLQARVSTFRNISGVSRRVLVLYRLQ